MKRGSISVALVALMGWGCQKASSEVDVDRSKVASGGGTQQHEGEATVERCGSGFRGQMITPRGETLQRETAQNSACTDDDCFRLTRGLLSPPHFVGASCDEVRKNIEGEPIVDVWGAQARVICNGYAAQAISAGRDGAVGTCDDIGITIPVNPTTFH